MAGNREVGFPKTTASSLREQLARTTLSRVRARGHPYLELREDGKRFIFFCTLCLSPCYSDTILLDHLRGNLHTERLSAAKATLLKPNPWPFSDGIHFFDASSGNEEQLAIKDGKESSRLLKFEENSDNLAIVKYVENLKPGCDTVVDENLSGSDEGSDLVIPSVRLKEEVSDLKARHVGSGQIAARMYEKKDGSNEISRIWCEWLGKESSNDEDKVKVLDHDFGVVTFAYDYELGKSGLFDDVKLLLSSSAPALTENDQGGNWKRKRSVSEPEDVSRSLTNQYGLCEEESSKTTCASSNLVLDRYDDQLIHTRFISSKTVRREVRKQQRIAAEKMCDICQQKMLPEKDVATLWNRKTGKLACSSRNVYGAFHVFHTSCLIHWILYCEFEIDLLSVAHDKYGSVFKLWLGPTQLLVSIKDPTLIKEMLLKAEDKLPFIGKAFRLAFGRSSLFFCSYDQAQKRRESLALELNGKMLGRANVIPKNVVDCIMERVDAVMSKGSVDCKSVSQHMAFTILGTTLFGDTFLAWSKATFYEELLMMIAKDASFWASYRVTPFWKRGFWRYQSLCTKLKCLTLDIVQQCGKNYGLFSHTDQNSHIGIEKVGIKAASGAPPSNGVEMQDKLFAPELDSHLNEREEPCGNIMGVMFHGCIATASLIGSILERLVTDVEIQDKIYSEIIKGKQGSVKEDQNVEKMLLLLATIYESARLLPAGPLLQRCSLKDDLIFKSGLVIPAGAVLVVPAQLLQMDDSSWGSDASKFNPYRFLSKARKDSELQDTSFTDEAVDPIQCSFILNDPNDNAAFLPFGSGMRACVGQKFAIHGVATLFASLLQRYEVRLEPQLANNPKSTTGPQIVFVRRNS